MVVGMSDFMTFKVRMPPMALLNDHFAIYQDLFHINCASARDWTSNLVLLTAFLFHCMVLNRAENSNHGTVELLCLCAKRTSIIDHACDIYQPNQCYE